MTRLKKPVNAVPEDAALFRTAVADVKPLPDGNRVQPQPAPRKTVVRSPMAHPPATESLPDLPPEEAPDEFLRDGVSRMTLRKLRRGNWPIQDSLDLHGSRSDAARHLLLNFLRDTSRRGLRCVLVIHGKGLNSKEGEAVLRKHARHWLARHPGVLAFSNAPPREGGSGAAIVLMRSAEDREDRSVASRQAS